MPAKSASGLPRRSNLRRLAHMPASLANIPLPMKIFFFMSPTSCEISCLHPTNKKNQPTAHYKVEQRIQNVEQRLRPLRALEPVIPSSRQASGSNGDCRKNTAKSNEGRFVLLESTRRAAKARYQAIQLDSTSSRQAIS